MTEQEFSRELFSRMLSEAGVPLTPQAMRAQWQAINQAEGTACNNDSDFSPFWRLITAIATRPCLWLVELLITHVLPNAFLRFAGGIYLDVFAWGVDIGRKNATFAQGQVLFTRASTGGDCVIPAGTWVESPPLGTEGRVLRVQTLADAVIPAGQLGLAVDVQAEAPGNAYNLGPGYYSILSQPVSGITGVTTLPDWLTVPGADTETDDSLRLRARNQFGAVGQLHHDAAYAALIAGFTGIRMDYLFFEKDGPRGPGTANCHMMIDSGIPPQELADQINQYIMHSGNHGHGDDLLCMPVAALPVSLAVRVYPVTAAGAERQEKLMQDVEHRIRCAFRQNFAYSMTQTYALGRFSFSRLADELHDALPDLRSVEFGRDSDIVSYLALPVLESLTVTLGASQ